MYLSSSKELGRVPLTLVCGEDVSVRRLFVSRLLAQLAPQFFTLLAQSPQVDGVYQEHAVRWFDGAMGTVEGDCLCCGLRSGLGDALRSIFLSALSNRAERLERVLIDASVIRSEELEQTLRHTPFLGQRFMHQSTIWVVDPRTFDVRRIDARLGGCVVVNRPDSWESEAFEPAFEDIERAVAAVSPELAIVRLFSEALVADMHLTVGK
jgi:G3E family GTPase